MHTLETEFGTLVILLLLALFKNLYHSGFSILLLPPVSRLYELKRSTYIMDNWVTGFTYDFIPNISNILLLLFSLLLLWMCFISISCTDQVDHNFGTYDSQTGPFHHSFSFPMELLNHEPLSKSAGLWFWYI